MIGRKRFSDRIIQNTVFNILGRGWGLLLALFLTPYFISRLGVEQYGIWVLLGVLTGYMGLLDMGIGDSFVRYIADSAAQRDEEGLNSIINTGLALTLALSLVGAPLVLAFRDPILHFVGVTSPHVDEARSALTVAMAGWAVSNGLWVFSSLQPGLQRMGAQNALQMGEAVLFTVLGVLFIERGMGLAGLAWASTISIAVRCCSNVFLAFRLWPPLRLGARWIRGHTLMKLLKFGYQLKLTVLADLVSFQTDKLLIGHFLGTARVVDYQLGSSLASTLRSYPTVVVSALMPAVAELSARNESGRVLEIYRRAFKYVVLMAFPLASLLLLFSGELIRVWMGVEFPQAALALRFLAVGYLFNVMGAAAGSIGAGIERPDILKRAAIFMATLNLGLSVLLIIRFGLPGVLFATTFSLISAHIYQLRILHAHLRIPMFGLWRDSIPKLLTACLLSGGAVYGLAQLWVGVDLPADRGISLALLAAKGTFFLLLYATIIFKSKYLDQSDIELLGRVPPLKPLLWVVGRTRLDIPS